MRVAASIVLVAAVAFLIAVPALFSTLAPYDDEGYCMMSLRTYGQGERLYGATHTQYGPAFFQFASPIHEWLVPLTQTGVRWKSAIAWMVVVILAFAVVRRLNKSTAVAIATALLAAVHLDKLALEPGHPQELVLLGFLTALYLATSPKPTASSWISLGLIAAIVGMTKINGGLILAMPILIAAYSGSPWFRATRFVCMAAAAFPGILVAWMARTDLGTAAWALWIAMAAAAFVTRFEPSGEFDHSPWLMVVLAGLVASCLIIAVTIMEGVTWSELWHGLIGQHADFTDDFFIPLSWTIGSAVGVLATVAYLAFRENTKAIKIMDGIMASIVCVFLLSSAFTPLQHGLIPRGAGMFLAWFCPAWIGFVSTGRFSESLGNRLISLLGIMSPLIAFPVSGTQVELGTITGLILFGAAAGTAWKCDRFDDRIRLLAESRWSIGKSFDFRVTRWLPAIAGLLCLAAATSHWTRYLSGTPLKLPGSEGMRLTKSVVEEQRAIVNAIISTHADSLVFEGHNNNRFFFWTGVSPATTATPTFWPRMLNEQERQTLEKRLNRPGRYCVVRVPNYELFYDARTLSLQNRLRTDWQPQASVGEWEIGILEIH